MAYLCKLRMRKMAQLMVQLLSWALVSSNRGHWHHVSSVSVVPDKEDKVHVCIYIYIEQNVSKNMKLICKSLTKKPIQHVVFDLKKFMRDPTDAASNCQKSLCKASKSPSTSPVIAVLSTAFDGRATWAESWHSYWICIEILDDLITP